MIASVNLALQILRQPDVARRAASGGAIGQEIHTITSPQTVDDLFNPNSPNLNKMRIDLYKRVGDALGVKESNYESHTDFGLALRQAVGQLKFAPNAQAVIAAIEEETGLKKLGVSLETVINAIIDPRGRDSDKLDAALEKWLGEDDRSIARGLARRADEYKKHLAACDAIRQGDRDGRGNLSEATLTDFTRFFLEICMDQTNFMSQLMQPKSLRDRIMKWAEEEAAYGRLPDKSPRILDAILFRGSLPRSEVAAVLGQSARSARDATSALSKQGIISSAGVRDDWQIAFPAKLAPRITPGLFPD